MNRRPGETALGSGRQRPQWGTCQPWKAGGHRRPARSSERVLPRGLQKERARPADSWPLDHARRTACCVSPTFLVICYDSHKTRPGTEQGWPRGRCPLPPAARVCIRYFFPSARSRGCSPRASPVRKYVQIFPRPTGRAAPRPQSTCGGGPPSRSRQHLIRRWGLGGRPGPHIFTGCPDN